MNSGSRRVQCRYKLCFPIRILIFRKVVSCVLFTWVSLLLSREAIVFTAVHSLKLVPNKDRESDLIVAEAPAPQTPLGDSIHRLPTVCSNRPNVDDQASLHADNCHNVCASEKSVRNVSSPERRLQWSHLCLAACNGAGVTAVSGVFTTGQLSLLEC